MGVGLIGHVGYEYPDVEGDVDVEEHLLKVANGVMMLCTGAMLIDPRLISSNSVAIDSFFSPTPLPNSNALINSTKIRCSGSTACKTLIDHLNSHSSSHTIYAFRALSVTRGITRKNRMVLPEDSSLRPSIYSDFCDARYCDVPRIGPRDLREPVMWGLDLTPQSCPFMVFRYTATYLDNNQTEECAVTLHQITMDGRYSLRRAHPEPVRCFLPNDLIHRKPERLHHLLHDLFQGKPVHAQGLNAYSLNNRAVVLKLK